MNYFNYFTDIEEAFIRRRGKHLLLSPLDWALIESWQERGIPLKIVLRGIENVFDGVDKNPNRTRTIKSLSYCREEIESQYAEWLETQVGKNNQGASAKEEVKKEKTSSKETSDSSLFSNDAIENHLANTIALLKRAKAKSNDSLRQILEEVLTELEKHRKTYKDAESLEESLNNLEDLIDKVLLESVSEEKLNLMKGEVAKNLANHKNKMEPDVYKRTFDLMLYKDLREQAEIPRLSLFYL